MESFAAEPASYSEQIDIKSFFSVALFDLSWSLEVSRQKFAGVVFAVSVWVSLASALAFLSYLDAKQKVVKAKKKGHGKTRKQGEERVGAATKEQESDEKQDEENGRASIDESESKGCCPSLGAFQQEAGPMLNAIIPNLEIPMALLGKLLFMPIVSTLLSWLRCDYSSEGQWNGEPTVVGVPASPGSLEPMVCWSTDHMVITDCNLSFFLEINVALQLFCFLLCWAAASQKKTTAVRSDGSRGRLPVRPNGSHRGAFFHSELGWFQRDPVHRGVHPPRNDF